jgi:hypothetical protein
MRINLNAGAAGQRDLDRAAPFGRRRRRRRSGRTFRGTLVLAGGGSFGGALAGVGAIDLASTLTPMSGAVLRASTIVESANLTLGQSESIVNSAGHIFDIQTSTVAPVTIVGVGSNTINNIGTLAVAGSGSATVQARVLNSGLLSVNGGSLTLTGIVTNTGTIAASAGLLTIQQTVGGTGAMTVAATAKILPK